MLAIVVGDVKEMMGTTVNGVILELPVFTLFVKSLVLQKINLVCQNFDDQGGSAKTGEQGQPAMTIGTKLGVLDMIQQLHVSIHQLKVYH